MNVMKIATAWLVGAAMTVSAAPPEVSLLRLPNKGHVSDVEVDAQGHLHAVYLSGKDVYYIKSEDGGKTLSKPIRVNTEDGYASGGGYRGPDVSLGKAGVVHVIWYTDGYAQKRPKDQWGVMYSRLEPGASAFEKDQNLNQRPSDNFAVAADGKGNVAVIWMADALYVQRSPDEGKTFSKPRRLAADPCECCAARAMFDATGQLQVMYREKSRNQRDMYVIQVNASDKVVGRTKLGPGTWSINACPMTGGFLSTAGDSAKQTVAAWEQKGIIYFSRIDGKGRVGPVEVARGKWPVAVSAAEGSVVAWKDGNRLMWRLFDDSGRAVGEVQSEPAGQADRPGMVMAQDGRILVIP